MKLSGWGRYPVLETELQAPRTEEALRQLLQQNETVIARGNGRAYGDSAIGTAQTVQMRHFNKMISFDAETGVLVAETGVLLGDVISSFLPRGWFPSVTPGTKFVTLGGVIAADAHGKNHHLDGSFGHCVDWIDVMDAKGKTRRCSRDKNSDLFHWTIGGMGLTGIILRAAIRLRAVESGWITQQMLPAENLDAAMAIFEGSQDSTYSVAWIDCLGTGAQLGRSLVMLGEHTKLEELKKPRRRRPFDIGPRGKKTVPLDFPSGALNRLSVRAFNKLYYWKGARQTGTQIVNWDSYFYPLDAILGWNRIYGRKGFMQFQCALPLDSSKAGLTALLQATSAAGAGSFLAVLKRFGAQDSRFSFPMEGYTLALDFPVNARTIRLMTKLDQITLEHGGRFYLAKDSRMTADTLRQSDDRVAKFVQMRGGADRQATFRSAQSERLSL